jgi:hypothetical protein
LKDSSHLVEQMFATKFFHPNMIRTCSSEFLVMGKIVTIVELSAKVVFLNLVIALILVKQLHRGMPVVD